MWLTNLSDCYRKLFSMWLTVSDDTMLNITQCISLF